MPSLLKNTISKTTGWHRSLFEFMQKLLPVVIIPSKNAINLSACLRSVWQHEPGIRVVVIDDGIDWGVFRRYCPDLTPTAVIRGVKPFVFARNVNLGIDWADDKSDVIILNDDALLQTYSGFRDMQAACYAPWRETERLPAWGMLAAATNNVGNESQIRRAVPTNYSIRNEARMLCFVCVFIPRSTLDLVGTLDERYVGYGLDDDDYSLRVRRAGLKLGIYDGCFVDHGSLTSSYRGAAGAGGNFHPNMKRFIEKWGFDNRECGRETSPFRALFPA